MLQVASSSEGGQSCLPILSGPRMVAPSALTPMGCTCPRTDVIVPSHDISYQSCLPRCETSIVRIFSSFLLRVTPALSMSLGRTFPSTVVRLTASSCSSGQLCPPIPSRTSRAFRPKRSPLYLPISSLANRACQFCLKGVATDFAALQQRRSDQWERDSSATTLLDWGMSDATISWAAATDSKWLRQARLYSLCKQSRP